MHEFFSALSLRKKLFILYSLFINLLVLIAVVLIYLYLYHTFEEQAQLNTAQLASQASNQIDLVLDNMDMITSTNQVVKENLSDAKFFASDENYFDANVRARTMIQETLLSLSAFNQQKYRISIYTDSGDYVSVGSYDQSNVINDRLQSQAHRKLIETIKELDGKEKLLSSHDDFWSDSSGDQYVSMIREIRSLEEDIISHGYVEVQIHYSVFEEICQFNDNGQIKTILFNEDNQVFYPFETQNIRSIISTFGEELKGERAIEVKRMTPDRLDEEYLSIHYSKDHHLYFVGRQSGQEIQNTFRPVLNIIIIALVMIVSMNMILVYVMTKKAFKPLKELTNFILDVSVEDLKLDIDSNDDNNILKLNEAFGLLFERISLYMDQMMALQSMEMKAQFNALQAQMSPHFIYNTISVIHASAQEIGANHIMTMCQKLSDMIRYVGHYNGAPMTINDEIDHINNYLELMSNRFEGKFTYSIEVEGSIGQVEVPKMILQPIVENCFNHGFTKISPPWHIWVKAYQEGAGWRIEVWDNGVGLSDQGWLALKEKIQETMASGYDPGMEVKIGGMSMVNILKRLKLQFGESMIFDVIQVEPRGLKIILGGRNND